MMELMPQEQRDAGVIASEINYIKRRTCEMVLANSVEIGRLLVEAKEKVPVGEWMSWLADNVNYSQSTANNLMRLYDEYGEKAQLDFFGENRLEIFGDLTPSQALALIPLPYSERKEYVETHDMSETSVRDIAAEVKARKDAEEKAEELEKKVGEAAEKNEELQDIIDELREQIETLEAEADEPEAPEIDLDAERNRIREELEKEYAVKIKEAKREATEKAKAKIEKLEGDIAKSEEEKKKAAEEIRKEAIREAEEKTAAEKQRWEEKLKEAERAHAEEIGKIKAASSQELQRFKFCFEAFQRDGFEIIKALGEISDEETRQKLAGGIKQVIAKIGAQI